MNANDTQVGGTHYRTEYQHWDFVAALRLGYFEGQITKYVTRHERKNGKQDLEKALHFAMKLRELHITSGFYRDSMAAADLMPHLVRYTTAHALLGMEADVIRRAVTWVDTDDLDGLVRLITALVGLRYPINIPWPRAHLQDGEADGNYVDQDR